MVDDFDVYFGVESDFLLDGSDRHLGGEVEDEPQMTIGYYVVVRGCVRGWALVGCGLDLWYGCGICGR